MEKKFFALLRLALDDATISVPSITPEEWAPMHDMAKAQCLLGLMYIGIKKLPKDTLPPREILLRWSFEANQLEQRNKLLNVTAAKLTQMFSERGLHPVILKGQANARLYPDALCRQPGDIDILIEGGRGGVINTLSSMGLAIDPNETTSNHHVQLDKKIFDGVTVEVHFRATTSFSPTKNRNLLNFLDGELGREGGRMLTPEGFYAPSISFALVMQLSHLRQHFFSTGIGLRQLVDYHQLLEASTPEERSKVSKGLKSFGLYHMAGAVMWLMGEVFNLSHERMLCEPDIRRGKWLLKVIMNGGNFGRYASDYKVPVFKRWLIDRKRSLRLMRFDASESIWHEILYWKLTLSLIPRRIKRGRIALGKR